MSDLTIAETRGAPRPTIRYALLVEDEALVAMVAEESLRIIGFSPRSVRTAQDALAVLGEPLPPALAVIDVGLPDMRGDILAGRARELAPDMPIIVASGYDEQELRQQFAHDPLIGVLSKPYTERDLARVAVALGLEIIEDD